jgi:Flagellar basal body rod FlgEFG protein C-terminal
MEVPYVIRHPYGPFGTCSLRKTSRSHRSQCVIQKNESAGPAILNDTGHGPAQVELSNVDLGEETINLIIGQRGFEANIQVLKTADEMLDRIWISRDRIRLSREEV